MELCRKKKGGKRRGSDRREHQKKTISAYKERSTRKKNK